MTSSRITSKGQITVPKAIRDTLGVEPGDRIAFRVQEDGRVVVEPETVDLRSLRGALKPRRRGVSVEEMGAAVRNQAAKRSRS
jgi:AbrB family looped-hinge helix DNA binding protein